MLCHVSGFYSKTSATNSVFVTNLQVGLNLATETEARNSIQTLSNGNGTEENHLSVLFCSRLRFTGFVWDFVLPSLSPLPSPSLV